MDNSHPHKKKVDALMTRSLTRVFASAATLALGLSGMVAVAAHATDPEYGNIVDKQDATITIHKMESGSLAPTPTVTADTENHDGDYLNNVKFKLFRLNLDLKTVKGWDALRDYKVPEAACREDGTPNWDELGAERKQDAGTPEQEVTTSDQGTATAEVSTGAYLVCEQPSTDVTNEAGETVTVVKKAHPFIVTAPTPHPGGQGGWLYKVHVYPKNTVLQGPVKTMTVATPGLGNADAVSITITTKIPSLAAEEHFQYFTIVDPLVAELGDAKNFNVQIKNGPGLSLNTDYAASHSASANNNAVTVNLTAEGLAKLEANKNKELEVSFQATMKALPATGKANNAAWVFVAKGKDAPGDPSAPIQYGTTGADPTSTDALNPPIRTKNTVGMTWGTFTIKKIDATDRQTVLEGAKFKVYVAQDQAHCTQGNVATEGDPIEVNTKSEFTTTGDGTVSIDGVHLHTKSVDGDNPDPDTTRCFIVEETQAPAGYVLPSTVNERKHPVLVNSADTHTEVVITNTQISGLPALPLTGAAGQLLLMLVGSALMLGSIGAFIVLRKRQADKA